MPNNGTKADPLVTSGSYKKFMLEKISDVIYQGKKRMNSRHVKYKINKILKNKKFWSILKSSKSKTTIKKILSTNKKSIILLQSWEHPHSYQQDTLQCPH